MLWLQCLVKTTVELGHGWVITFNVTNACYYSYTVWPPPRIGGANDFPLFRDFRHQKWHYNDVIMGVVSSQITSLTIVYSTVTYTGADQKKHQSSASPAFMRGIHRRPVTSPHKWPITRKHFPFDDVIMGRGVSMLEWSWNYTMSTLIYRPKHHNSQAKKFPSDSFQNFRLSWFFNKSNMINIFVHNEHKKTWRIAYCGQLTHTHTYISIYMIHIMDAQQNILCCGLEKMCSCNKSKFWDMNS